MTKITRQARLNNATYRKLRQQKECNDTPQKRPYRRDEKPEWQSFELFDEKE